jgi:polysaccharide biosynthesis protein PslH
MRSTRNSLEGTVADRPQALVLSPEVPYPLNGGGPMRTASLLHALARQFAVDLITFRQPGAPDPRVALPPGLVRDVWVVDLPPTGRSGPSRAARNLGRLLRGVPPLIDRFAGFELPLHRKYDVGLVEHLWAASYANALRACCRRLILDLHNVESRFYETSASSQEGPKRWAYQRFAEDSARFEREWIPRFDGVLVCSEADREAVGDSAGQRPVVVFPNSLPWVDRPNCTNEPILVSSGNWEYHPNLDGALWFVREIWPELSRRIPELRLRFIGRNEANLREKLSYLQGKVEFTGPVEDPIHEIARGLASFVPIRAGSGTRIKILEAFAAGTPVISTPLGAEGLEVTHGEEILIADSKEAWTHHIQEVWDSHRLRTKLSCNARRRFEVAYTWEAAWNQLDSSGLLQL